MLTRVLRSLVFFLWVRGQQTFSVKGQIEIILVFAGHTVSVRITQLRYCSVKAGIDM